MPIPEAQTSPSGFVFFATKVECILGLFCEEPHASHVSRVCSENNYKEQPCWDGLSEIPIYDESPCKLVLALNLVPKEKFRLVHLGCREEDESEICLSSVDPSSSVYILSAS